MTITINGEARELESACNLNELLVQLRLEGKPVIAELNLEALSPSEFGSRQLQDGDQLELIMIAAGG